MREKEREEREAEQAEREAGQVQREAGQIETTEQTTQAEQQRRYRQRTTCHRWLTLRERAGRASNTETDSLAVCTGRPSEGRELLLTYY